MQDQRGSGITIMTASASLLVVAMHELLQWHLQQTSEGQRLHHVIQVTGGVKFWDCVRSSR